MSNESNVDVSATKDTSGGLRRYTIFFAAIFVVALGALFTVRNLSESSDIPYNRSNLILVIPSCEERLPLVEASRAWRDGLRTVIILNGSLPEHLAQRPDYRKRIASGSETYLQYDDVDNSAVWWLKKGDLRAAFAPFLANITIGSDSYSWILYGDDDTFFNIEAALRMVNRLNHSMPYLLSDNIWFPEPGGVGLNVHPSKDAPRCLPCQTGSSFRRPLKALASCTWTLSGMDAANAGYASPVGCPCTPELLCQSDNLGLFEHGHCTKDALRYCTVLVQQGPPWPHNCTGFTNTRWGGRTGRWYFAHGGAGMVMSAGAMGQASFQDVSDFLLKIETVSSDSMVSLAFWSVLGIGITDPGVGSLKPHVQMFDPGWRMQSNGSSDVPREDKGTVDGGNDPEGVLERLADAMIGRERCDRKCHDQLRNAVTVHIRSRHIEAVDTARLNRYHMLSNVPEKMQTAAYYHLALAEAFQKYEHFQSVMGVLGQAARRETHCSGSLIAGDYIVLVLILVVLVVFGGYFMHKYIRRRGLPLIGVF